jgi:hypothetical protein
MTKSLSSPLNLGDILWAQTSVYVPALHMLQLIPGSDGDCDSAIAQSLENIEKKHASHPKRPCVYMSGTLGRKSALRGLDTEWESMQVCAMGTFRHTPYHKLPEILRDLVAPVNYISGECPHEPVYLDPSGTCGSLDHGYEWIICFPFQLNSARVSGYRKYDRMQVKLSRQSMGTFRRHEINFQDRILERAAQDVSGNTKLRLLDELLVSLQADISLPGPGSLNSYRHGRKEQIRAYVIIDCTGFIYSQSLKDEVWCVTENQLLLDADWQSRRCSQLEELRVNGRK